MIKANGEDTCQPQALPENQDSEARGDEKPILIHADRDDLSQTRRVSAEAERESFRSAGTDLSSSHAQHRKISIRQVLGKILSRVDELEQKYLAYVESHQQRLAQRLTESESRKEEALHLVAEIREMTALLDRQLDEEEEEP